jgi:phosphatidate cytidylyltransferase
MKRVLTALVLIPFALYGIYFAPQWLFVVIAAAMALLCHLEFERIAAAHGFRGCRIVNIASGLLLLWRPDMARAVLLAAMAAALRAQDLAKYLATAAISVLGVIYVFGAWRCAIDLRAISPHWVFFALAINWMGDIAAYYVGRSLGRRKLAPRISPGKSWEGSIASALAAVLFALAFRQYLGMNIGPIAIVMLAILANAAGQAGDLAESAIKRGAGLKDSGVLLPGHGGFLDRLDSSLFTMPVVYYFLQLNR